MNELHKTVSWNGQNLLLTPPDIDFSRRILSLTGVIDEAAAAAVNAALRILARESEEDILLYIQSPGGSVSAGFSIYDTIQAIRCDVVTVGCGMVASTAAFLLSAAGTKGKRWVQPNAEVLIHQPLGGVSGQASDICIQAEHILRVRERLNQLLADATGKTETEIEQDTDRDAILSAEEARLYGLADHIGDPITQW